MTNVLTVWWDDEIVGSLSVDRHGDTAFAYAEEWLSKPSPRAISVSLPLRREAFSRRESRPFFEGLLPEESQRVAIAGALGLSEENEFRLLEALGGEVAGALSLWPESDKPPERRRGQTATKPLDDDALVDVLERLPARPMLAGQQGLRLSLAGAQAKLPVAVVDGAIALPAPGQPTTHILKPPIARFQGATENEAFSMRLAHEIGLSVAAVDYRTVWDRAFLLVKRYDRIIDETGEIKRLHQEDFCQALGFPSARKYAADGGPVFTDCFALVRSATTRPAREVLKLFDAAIFNLIIGNADAHGKNYSLLYKSTGVEMAPLYDLLSTVAYPDLSPRLAMKIARRATLGELRPADWRRFAEETGLTEPYVKRRARELAEAANEAADRTVESFDLGYESAEVMKWFSTLVNKRASQLSEICR